MNLGSMHDYVHACMNHHFEFEFHEIFHMHEAILDIFEGIP